MGFSILSRRKRKLGFVSLCFLFTAEENPELLWLTTDIKKYIGSPDLQGTHSETLHGCLEFQMLLNMEYICSNINIAMMLNHRNNNYQQQLIIK